MKLGGYRHKEAWVDLTSGTVEYRAPKEEDLVKYVGARGLGVKYLFDHQIYKVDPLSPENMLCVMTGPLTGTRINMSGRLCTVTRSPLTGTVTDSHMGGWTAARLKWAGFDNLIFTGKSDKPVYLYVEDGKAELRDASHLWGMGTRATIKYMRDKYGKDVSVMTIGPAGENQVLFAGFINEDDRAAGRGGTGAVAGSKNLKAIVIRASQKGNMPEPARPDEYPEAIKAGLKALMEGALTAPKKGGLSVYGTNVLMNIINEVGALPSKNSQETYFPTADEISGETVRNELLVSDPTCHACPVACKIEVEVKEGPYKTRVESFEYESAWALGPNCGTSNKEAVAYLIDLCNEYGMDTIELGNTLSMAMEAYEKGLHQEPIPWGDVDTMIALTEKIARREGFGDILANGTARAAKHFGDPDIAMVVKNQAIPAYDPRGIQGIGLGYATSNRGACHLRGYTVASEIAGIPEPTDRLKPEGKGELLKIFQDLHAFSDSLDLCKFSSFSENADLYAKQYTAVVGIDLTGEDIMKIGERIYNLERYFNNLAGFGYEDDLLPKRFLQEPAGGNSKGSVSHLDVMLNEYYQVRGWEKGVVTKAKLQELGINEAVGA
ncbi:aldehyde ferredoxin oxidoreductase [Caldalkalibacillus thermarum TA2.A1]|uniref:Aldehyde ferredoxin oxidoreductase n=1 Tax=Caldalkalibacillus thermarum (strain TA2.A1) TaxID=986075 RepID=F5LAI7_CALTT|nr:aldehyde ferredoxin oxidoreductase family protein [Caldalkalibacillus thermarum]EGL81736.1 aldehyde ferredoxin oxidoreductase [Caldalkalibacillus thermarum TA2.A1]QZT33320.1 aldehyde ferredoxin oxidoreductase family protein [Caldalkalibacillus thermarum TA2.A1]